jgi:hypothetical protein
VPKTELVDVFRIVTSTPLAREHDHVFDHGDRRPRRPVPWKRFRRDDHPEPALDLAFDLYRKLASGEYGAVAAFSQLTAALALVGAPFDLVSASTRAAADEMRHAELALRMAILCRGRDFGVRVDRAVLDRRFAKKLSLHDIDLLMVEVPVLGETMAAALLMATKKIVRESVAKAITLQLVADEVHHARLGWYYMHWRAPQWTRAEKQRVANRAGELVASTEYRFWLGRDAPKKHRPAAAALGVLDSPTQRAAVREVMEREIVPGLDALGLGGSHAWRVRRRGGS